MPTQTKEGLDAEELFHCALEASNRKQHDQAIELLKRSIDLEDHPAKRLVLAAEHAEIKMYDRAIAGMKSAITMAPQLWVAHFQLGQLYLITQQLDEAKTVWQHLMNTNEAPKYFQTLAQGLLAITDNKIEEGVEWLRQGIGENTENPALNGDIERIIEVTLNPSSSDEQEDDKAQDDDSAVNKMLLSRYTQH
ncbi:hypothetical protein [Microbulbifer rhizosphaerae]|uniref:Tetratricopeptide (TPR) repeat protein n=1 Tax=Microbulbifer rhizosphaerae TaxID=1562603 RepID=A0A7W4Z8L2_9GAMM|nr:hypothetical protein [Microbulbifer rhizosphaerae]MBB3060928.1 tetratricopeptide (TPR) repeat protein [Microbulbifer rhizosphaerae]